MVFKSIKEIRRLIRAEVQNKIESGNTVNQEWQATEILNMHDGINGPDKEFYLITARQWVNEEVKSAIGLYEPKEDDEPKEDGSSREQLVLEGFEHLQKAYPVKRGKVRELVPLDQMTDEELEEKALEYEAMAIGCTKHAAEIRSFRIGRQASA